MKNILLAISIIFVLFLVGCNLNENVDDNQQVTNQEENIVKNGDTIQKEDESINIESKETYYIYDGVFMGSFHNETWYSPLKGNYDTITKTWKYSDLLKSKSFNTYTNLGDAKEINKLSVSLEPGIGDFLGLGILSDSGNIEQYREAFHKYTTGSEKGDTFTLPTDLSSELNELVTTFENTTFYMNEKDIVMTNADWDLVFAPKQDNIALSNNAQKFLNNYFLQKDLSIDIKYSCFASYKVDIDKDGNEDNIYALHSNHMNIDDYFDRMQNITDNGAFTLIIADVGNSVKTIYDFSIAKNSTQDILDLNQSITQVDIVDLNNDNVFECCFVIGELGSQNHYIVQYSENTFKTVAYNYIGQ